MKKNCEPEGKKSKVWIVIVIGVLAVALITAGILLALPKNGDGGVQDPTAQGSGGGGSNTPTFDMSVPHKVEPPDAEALLESYGQILSKTPAADSQQVQSESGLVSDLDSRGLWQFEIVSEYNMSGEYLGESGISSSSNALHPRYSTYYQATNGELWVITCTNGVITAEPFGYNYVDNDGTRVPVMVTETDSICSYDGITNTFFDFVPDATVIRLVKVEKIDSQTLEGLTNAQLGG